MKIFLVERRDGWDYDEYDSFVVVCEDEKTARCTSPYDDYVWNPVTERFEMTFNGETHWLTSMWPVHPKDLRVTYLGEARENYPNKVEVVCASFNAG